MALALPLALVTACGNNSDTATDPAPTSAAPSSPSSPDPSPQCDTLWVAGESLPGGYQGCYEGAKLVKANGRYCEFGKPLITYDERFYAVSHGRIIEAKQPFAKDARYQDTLAKCSG